MYAKVFGQIYDGTLCTSGPWEALVTFQQLLVLADKNGVVDMTPVAISRRTTIPLDIIEKGIAALLLDDPCSRTPTENGRRILPLSEGRNWGWVITNYKHYSAIRTQEDRREYHREYWHKRKAKADSTENSTDSTKSTESTDIDVNVDTNVKGLLTSSEVSGRRSRDTIPCPHQKIIDLYHELCPMMPGIVEWTKARETTLRVLWNNKRVEEKWETEADGIDYFASLFRYCAKSKFLTGQVSSRDGRKPFVASLPWIIKPENFAKISEGRYA